VLFGLLSFIALREFVSLVPTRRADHRVLLGAFFAAIPLQYTLVMLGWYGPFALLVPIGGALAIAAGCALAGDTERFTGRVGEIQLGLMVCVYSISYVPALLMLRIPEYAGQNANLLLFLVIVVESSDVLQYVWGKLAGRTPLAPTVSPNKTWEGFVGGVLAAVGMAFVILYRDSDEFLTIPESLLLGLVIALAAVLGDLFESAVKRDLEVKDSGRVLGGHGGMLDRLDSLLWAGPAAYFTILAFGSA
jgi:phosphatidate cytidylyltransferase